MAKKPLLKQDILRQLLDYNPETGTLTWRQRIGKWSSRWNKRYAGKIAGCQNHDGYICIKIHDQNLLAHRVIWAWEYGVWPECVDHRDGNPSNNRLGNLRAVTREISQRNQKRHNSNTSGRAGVSWNRFRQKWIAHVGHRGLTIYLGAYEDFDVAVVARKAAEKVLGFTGRV